MKTEAVYECHRCAGHSRHRGVRLFDLWRARCHQCGHYTMQDLVWFRTQWLEGWLDGRSA